jgi:hypothetical protein
MLLASAFASILRAQKGEISSFDFSLLDMVHWAYDWTISRMNSHELVVVRANDGKGRRQPAERSSDRIDDYECNACQPIRVMVR